MSKLISIKARNINCALDARGNVQGFGGNTMRGEMKHSFCKIAIHLTCGVQERGPLCLVQIGSLNSRVTK